MRFEIYYFFPDVHLQKFFVSISSGPTPRSLMVVPLISLFFRLADPLYVVVTKVVCTLHGESISWTTFHLYWRFSIVCPLYQPLCVENQSWVLACHLTLSERYITKRAYQPRKVRWNSGLICELWVGNADSCGPSRFPFPVPSPPYSPQPPVPLGAHPLASCPL